MAGRILFTEDLTRAFPGPGQDQLLALDHVSLELYEGEALALTGPSGSGKSTLARLLTRQLDPTEGKIVLFGEDITKKRGKTLLPVYRQMQMVFQSPVDSFDPRKTIGYSLAEPLRNCGYGKGEAAELAGHYLFKCGLPEAYAKRYPHQLSGGQCQRAAIARAIAIRPAILICDEITSALDVTVRKEIMDLLGKLRREMNLSLLFISHDPGLVQSFCDRAVTLRHGRIVE